MGFIQHTNNSPIFFSKVDSLLVYAMVGTLFDKIKCREEQDLPFFSLEYFPPRTKAGAVNLFSRFDRMAAGDPLFIDITWGAGGGDPCHNDFTGSLAVASTALNYCGLVTMLHLTCVNSTKDEMRAILQKAKDCGIKNVMALRGGMCISKIQCQNVRNLTFFFFFLI